jgi:hypothetical protein
MKVRKRLKYEKSYFVTPGNVKSGGSNQRGARSELREGFLTADRLPG